MDEAWKPLVAFCVDHLLSVFSATLNVIYKMHNITAQDRVCDCKKTDTYGNNMAAQQSYMIRYCVQYIFASTYALHTRLATIMINDEV